MRVKLAVFNVWMFSFGARDHFGGEVNADAVGGLQVGNQASHAAANFKDALVGIDEKFVNFDDSAVIPASQAAPAISFFGDSVPVGDAGLLIGFACCVKWWGYFHGGMILPEYFVR